MTLMAHCGTTYKSEQEVRAVPAPAWTKTWHPVSHGAILDALGYACEQHGLGIRDRAYSMSADGNRLFGTWTLDVAIGGTGYAVGFRHAIDKSMLIGLATGSHVFICDNLAFTGEKVVFRKHTGGLTHDTLRTLAVDALGNGVIEMEKEVDWQNGLNEKWISSVARKAMTVDLIDQGVVPLPKYNKWCGHLDEEIALVSAGVRTEATLGTVFQATTRLLRGESLWHVEKQTKKLKKVVKAYEPEIDRLR